MNDQVSTSETAKLLELAQKCLTIPGDFVELGCYRGDTSIEIGKVMSSAQGRLSPPLGHKTGQSGLGAYPAEGLAYPEQKRLYLFDSFSGLPEKSSADQSGAGANFQAGALAVSKREVVDKLRRHGLKNVIIKKAWFSDLTPDDLPEQIAFAFIDGDFYESQVQGLKLVAPRLAKQGIIICHDYHNPELPGATRAVDEFLRAHPEFSLQNFSSLAILWYNR